MQKSITVGVFWLIEGYVYGQSEIVKLTSSNDKRTLPAQPHCSHSDQENLADKIVDTELEHWRVWETSALISKFAHQEYFDFPRGRLLYNKARNTHLIFCDTALLKTRSKAQIATFFGLDKRLVAWRSDLHYATNSKVLNNLFND